MRTSRASEHWTKADIVNPILQAISNSISIPAMPASFSAAPAVPAQRGGFASTLAAAQGLSTASQRTANEGSGSSSSGLLVGSTKATTGRAVTVPPAQGPQQKKALSSGSAPAATVPLPDTNLTLLSTSLPGTSPPNVNSAGTAQSEIASVAGTTAQNIIMSGLSALTDRLMGASIANQITCQGGGRETLMSGQLGSGIVPPNNIPPTNIAQDNIPPNSVPPNSDPSGPRSGSQPNGVGSAPAEALPALARTLAGTSSQMEAGAGTVQPVFSRAATPNPSFDFVAPGAQSAGAFLPNQIAVPQSAQEVRAAGGAQPGDISINVNTDQVISRTVQADANPGSQRRGSAGTGLGLAMAESIPQANQAVGSTPPGAMVVGNASSDAGPGAGGVPLALAITAQIAAANSASVSAPGTGAQPSLSAQTGAGSVPFATVNWQNSGSTMLNVAAPISMGRAALPFAAPSAALPNPIAPAVVPGAPVATPSSTVPTTGPDPGNGAPTASQTPFSVFFSGPGTESAASALPKMILPTAGPAGHNSHPTLSGAPGSSPQINNAPSGAQNAPPQNSNSNSKDSRAGSASASLQMAQPPRQNGDPVAANMQAAAPTVQAPTPVSTGSNPALGGQPALAAELPKASPQPASGQDGPTRAVPWAPEQAAVVPGPVQVAQLVTRMGQSEMRIGMNTSAFGSVEVRTVVHASDVGLIIGSEKGDLRTLLANDIPAITHTLQQQNLRLNSVNFMQGFAFSNHASGGGDSQPRSFVPMRSSANSGLPETTKDVSRESGAAAEFDGGRSSLSILA